MVGMTVPFTETDLRRIAAPRSFERGLGYVDGISRIDVSRERATATVHGSDAYFVSLTWVNGDLDGACTCPHGAEGFFCKHCVALGLKLLTMGDDLVSAAEVKRSGLADNFEMVDESLDWVGGDVYDLFQAHRLACKASPPDVADLAGYLAKLLLRDDYGVVPDVKEYADLLGEEGIALIRQVIADAFAREPSNWMARNWLEAQARADGDVDALVVLFATNLDSRGVAHMQIVRELESAERHAEALTWAERGLRECSYPDNKLVDTSRAGMRAPDATPTCSSCAVIVSRLSGLWPVTGHSVGRLRHAATGLPSGSPRWRNSVRPPSALGVRC